MDSTEEENPNFRKFWTKSPNPEERHHWGECMEDWHDYEWRKEQKEMDYRREEDIWEIWIAMVEEKKSRDAVL